MTRKLSLSAMLCLLCLGGCIGPVLKDLARSDVPEDCPYRIAILRGASLYVRDQEGTEWSLYGFSPRASNREEAISLSARAIAYDHVEKVGGHYRHDVEIEFLETGRIKAIQGFTAATLFFSPDGSALAMLGGYSGGPGRAIPDGPRGLFVWEIETGKVRFLIDVRFGFWDGATVSWDGSRHVVVNVGDRRIMRVNTQDPLDVELLVHGKDPSMSPDGKYLAYEHSGKMWVRDLATGQETALYDAPSKWLSYSMAVWTPDSRYVAYIRRSRAVLTPLHSPFVLCTRKVPDGEETVLHGFGGYGPYHGYVFIDPAIMKFFPPCPWGNPPPRTDAEPEVVGSATASQRR